MLSARESIVATLCIALSCYALPVAPLDYDPYDVGFDGTGFDWLIARAGQGALLPGSPPLIAMPPARRVTFRFNATSGAPCAETKSALRIFFAGEFFRTVYLERAGGFFALTAPSGTAFELFARALVRVPIGQDGRPAPTVWAVADGPLVYSGVV
jgi:hypothetical protein